VGAFLFRKEAKNVGKSLINKDMNGYTLINVGPNNATIDGSAVGTVTSVNSKEPTLGAVTIVASDITITDTNNIAATDTVQSAIDGLFQYANSGKTQVANAIGSPATSDNTFAQLATHITDLKSKIYGADTNVLLDESVSTNDIIRSYYKTMSVSKAADPSGTFAAFAAGGYSSASTVAFSTSWSANNYLAVGCNGTAAQGFVHVFSQNSNGTFTKSPIPTTQPSSTCNAVAISKEGTYVAAATLGATNLFIYKRSGDSFTSTKPTFSNTSVVISPPLTIGSGRSVDFSSDGNFLACGHDGTPFLAFYQRVGDTFTKQSTPIAGEIPNASVYGVSWSSDGVYLSCVTSSGGLYVYKKTGTTLSLVYSSTVPGAGWSISFSPDSTYLAVGHANSPFMTLFKKGAGDTWSTGPTLSENPTGTVRGISWSPESMYLCTAHSSGNFMTIFKRSSSADSFLKQSDPTTLVPAQGNGISFSPDQTYWAIAHSSSPLAAGNPTVSIYRNASTVELFRKMTSPSTSTVSKFDVAFGIAKETGVAGDTKKCDMIVGGGVT
jgi:6-phosphogluconolactonase (cycloisomerase 2 family)